MRSFSDINIHDGSNDDTLVDPLTDWLESPQDNHADGPEADPGDGGALKPWKITDI